MPGLCLAGESPETQGFSLLQKTLSSILGQKVMQQPQQTTTSLEKPATKKEREREREKRESITEKNQRRETGQTDSERKHGRETKRGEKLCEKSQKKKEEKDGGEDGCS